MKTMNLEYVQRILGSRVYDVARETALDHARSLSERLGNTVYFKREDTQPVHSFKLRGAYNKMAMLTDEERARGVICASAGNHAQGVAFSAQKMGIRAVIVMPATTPDIKVKAVRGYGAEVVLFGDSYSDAEAHAYQLQAEQGFTFVHPYDDPYVIAGQGTVGLEILQQCRAQSYTVFVPIGGGGLAAGIAVLLKSVNPNIKIVAVEPEDSDAMTRSVEAGERVTLSQVGIFVDGVAVKRVGEHTFNLVRQYVDEYVRVSTDEVCAAIKDIFDDTRAVQEPAGALATAGMTRYVREKGIQGETLVALTCGANINFNRLRHVAERANVGEQKEAIIAVTIPERPGAFKGFIQALGKRNITEFNYRYAPSSQAHIFVGVQMENPRDRRQILEDLSGLGYAVTDLSQDELAVVHVRHMVGGRAPEAENERIYSFVFPERPGALSDFLNAMQATWNISLFHYRNHGSSHGRVLCGIQVPEEDMHAFQTFLDRLGYEYQCQEENPAYKLFLR